jgi:hypothetical protein
MPIPRPIDSRPMTPLENALDLAARGAYVFPCQEYRTTPEGEPDDRKKPKPGIFWGRASTRDPAQIERWWTRWPDALIGLDLGKMGIFVADADRKPGRPDGVQGWLELCAEHGYSDAEVPRVSTASQGEHLYFRQPEGAPIGNKKVGVSIDGRGAGGYVIAPGSRFTDDDRDYRLMWGDILNTAPMPQWLVDRLRASQAQPLPQTPANVAALPVPTREPGNREAAYASRAIEEEARTLAGMGKDSGRNNALNTAAFNLGQLVAGGLLDAGEVREALVAACHQNGLVKEDGMRSVLASIRSGLSAGARKPRTAPEQEDAPLAFIPRQVCQEGDDLIDEETGEIIETAAAQPEEPEDDTWRHPQGMVREIAEWVMAVSHRPSWPLSLASAVATMATLCSRHMVGPTGLGSHVYIMSLAASASGKGDPLAAPETIINELDKRVGQFGQLKKVVQATDWASGSAIEKNITACPTQLSRIDEIDGLFSRIYSKRSSTHEASMAVKIKALYSIKPRGLGSAFTPSSRAGMGEVVKIEAPALTIFGASVPDAVFSALAGITMTDGFLNRWLIIDAPDWPPRNDKQKPPVPERVLNHLAGLFPASAGNLGGGPSVLTLADGVPDPLQINFASPEVRASYNAFWERIDTIQRQSSGFVQNAYGRAVENALRLAMIHAVGRDGRRAAITQADWDWSVSMVLRSVRAMLKMVGDHMSENEGQAAHKRVFKIIKDAGKAGILRRDLMQVLGGAVKARDVNDIISSLQQAEQIAESKVEAGAKGGRPGVRYHAI